MEKFENIADFLFEVGTPAYLLLPVAVVAGVAAGLFQYAAHRDD